MKHRFHCWITAVIYHCPSSIQQCFEVGVVVCSIISFWQSHFYIFKFVVVYGNYVSRVWPNQNWSCGVLSYFVYLFFNPGLHTWHTFPLFTGVVLSTDHNYFSAWVPGFEINIEFFPTLVIKFLIGKISRSVDTVDANFECGVS